MFTYKEKTSNTTKVLIGRSISRKEAIELARTILRVAEKERIETAEKEARGGINYNNPFDISPSLKLANALVRANEVAFGKASIKKVTKKELLMLLKIVLKCYDVTYSTLYKIGETIELSEGNFKDVEQWITKAEKDGHIKI